MQCFKCGFSGKRFQSFLIILLISFAGNSDATSPEDLISSQVNYAYANYLGTGFYTAADRTVQVYHLPFRYTLSDASEDKTGLQLRLPVTIGFLDFDLPDAIDPNLPSKIETLSFVPGIQYIYRVNNYWSLSPFLDLGIGHDFETDNSAYVYGAGVNSLLVFRYTSFNLEIYNEFLFAGNTTEISNVRNEFSRFQTGINFQFPLNNKIWNRETAVSVYYLNYLYFNRLEFLRYLNDPIEVAVQNEVGLTFDTSPDMKLLGIPFSRIGLGYRFGNDVNVIRLVFGIPF
jgi:hypothetical protein